MRLKRLSVYFERYDKRVAEYNAGKYGTGPDAYEKFVQANMVDALTTASSP